ncbi:zinc finger CCCH domain-containing protein 14 isoform X2 [Bacillus rossius redtenbacheri]|uniref:zinc finger CCCH domain-containing protein 14 isoform X2 n=1 Tax=Bacillus rossius redtenbacheri TaxID=93214 RepID=UPI002FDD96FB
METIATDVSLKIKSAIKAKLIELGLYTDEELPDYIMVMVANKRTRAQMVEDLQLFLGTSTEHFTNWLHQVLEKLQEVTVASIEKKKLTKQMQEDKPNKKSKESSEEERKVSRRRSSAEERKSDEGKLKHVKIEKDLDWVLTDNQRGGKNTKVTEDDVKRTEVETRNTADDGAASDARKTEDSDRSTSVRLEEEKHPKISGSVSHARAPVTKPKIVLMQSDDDDDDEDFINIKADAEAAELLDAELPEDSPSHSFKPSTPEKSVSPPPAPARRPSKELSKAGPVEAEAGGVDGQQQAAPSEDRREAGRRSARRSSSESSPVVARLPGQRVEGPVQATKRPAEPTSDETSPKKRTMLSRVVALHRQGGRIVKEEVEEEYDPTNPAVGTVASVVRVKPRPKVPAALQASRNLILKAVAEAQKSVAAAPVRRDPSERPSELRTKRYQMKVDMQAKDSEANSHNDWKGLRLHENNNSDVTNRSLSTIRSSENLRIRVTSGESRNVDSPSSGKTLSRLTSTDSEMEPESTSLDNTACSVNTTERPESPQFVVTLDGLERSLFEEEDDYELQKIEEQKQDNADEKSKRHRSPIIFSPNTTTTVSTSSSKVAEAVPLKSIDRCRFWPACRLGDKCTFSHPTTPCKSFPSCKFGEKCLYIHPNCKFDAACTRRDCPFTHASPRLLAPIYPGASAVRQPTQMCKFFPNCSNANCPFLHPKPCRYGKYCSKKGCTYQHHSNKIPAVHKLKWSSHVPT